MGCVLAVILWVDMASATLRGQLKAPWTLPGRSRRLQHSALRKRAGDTNRTQLLCQATAPAISAPRLNVWGSLTDVETAAVLEWLYRQPELNLTAGPPELPSFTNFTRDRPSSPQWDNRV